jgi:hypothetical protein
LKQKSLKFVQLFILSTLLDYASYFYYGVWNWYFLSWQGFLIIPVFPLCNTTPGSGCPGRFLPLFGLWPVKKFLGLYGLCQSTYAEDKEAFQKEHPGLIAIDDEPRQSVAGVSAIDV